MAKTPTKSNPRNDDIVVADGEELNLRNRNVAAFLAWMIPGAGHYYQRRYFKSATFFLCIMSSFLIGWFVADGKCVYASWNQTEKRWQFILQAGIGLPAMPAAVQAWRQRNGHRPWGNFMVAPKDANELDDWNAEMASGFDMGTLYTMVAGLLNVLVIFDAYAGPLPPPANAQGKSKEDEPPSGESS